jgi:hypothetical protein
MISSRPHVLHLKVLDTINTMVILTDAGNRSNLFTP